MYNAAVNIDILGRVQSGGGEGKRGTSPALERNCDVGPHVPRKGAMLHPRDRREINSSGVSCVVCYVCVYIYVSPLRGTTGVGRGEDENGTVIAKGRGWMMTLIARDSRDRCSRLPRKITY